jgi:hypothetical protein
MNSLYIVTAAGFLLLALGSAFLLISLLLKGIAQTSWTEERKQKIKSRILFWLVLWFIFLGVLSISGWTEDFDLFPLNMAPVLGIPFITVLILSFSKSTGEVLHHISIKNVIRLQIFRLFVEILLWLIFIQHLLPVQMTFEGRNWDVLTGISAPLMAFFFSNKKGVLIIWNFICLGLLINIVSIAILSMPTPFRLFDNEPANTIVTVFPFIFLPGFLVPLAYTLHLISLKQLMTSTTSYS